MRNQSGQTIIEYIFLLAVIVSLAIYMTKSMKDLKIADKLMSPLKKEFAASYQFGHPKAKGFEGAEPEFHARVVGGNNFRIFLNPYKK